MASPATLLTLFPMSSRHQSARTLSSTTSPTIEAISIANSPQNRPHRHGQEQEAAICREREGRSPDLCRVLGNWYVRNTIWGRGDNGLGNRRADILSRQAALSHVFLVSPEVVLTVLVKQHSVTCAVPVACSHPPRSGGDGTRRSTLDRSEQLNNGNGGFDANIILGASQLHLPLLHHPTLLFSSPAVTVSRASQRSLSLFLPPLSPAQPSQRHLPLSLF